MSLSASRPPTPLAGLPGYGCRWTDAMGYEQAGYSDVEDWTGGAVQLACIEQPGKPLGNPFRFHLRLFRAGNHTFGGAHYEWNIQGTAEHEPYDRAQLNALVDLGQKGVAELVALQKRELGPLA